MRSGKTKGIENSTSIIKAINGENNGYVPVWLMRQAGRYLEEYRRVRSTTNSFLEFCYSPEKAAEVTLQPIKRFGFDAAIIFSDILVIPDALGVKVEFQQGEGPVLEKTNIKTLDRLEYNPEKLLPVYEAIKIVRRNLSPEKSLIGFAGAPWTLATYMVEGGSSKDFQNVKSWAYADEKSFSQLIYKIADAVADHAIAQVKSGCDVLQVFDSWASAVTPGEQFEKWIIEPTAYVVSKIKSAVPGAPIIGFPRGAGAGYVNYAKEIGIDAMSVDYNTDIGSLADKVDIALQGNLDPVLLKANKDKAVAEAKRILSIMSGRKFIFNLGHGILPETPIENVQALVDVVREEY